MLAESLCRRGDRVGHSQQTAFQHIARQANNSNKLGQHRLPLPPPGRHVQTLHRPHSRLSNEQPRPTNQRPLLHLQNPPRILVGWNLFVMPRFMPPKPKAVQNQAEEKPAGEDREPPVADKGLAVGPGESDESEGEPSEKPDGEKLAAADKPDAEEHPDAEQPGEKDAPDKLAAAGLPKFPEKTVKLGSDEFLTGYRQLVTLTSKGAAVKQIELNDPRYRTLKKDVAKRHPPLVVVGAPVRAKLARASSPSQRNEASGQPQKTEEPQAFRNRVPSSPKARRLAAERGVDMNRMIAAACCTWCAVGVASAQNYPTKTVRIIVPYPAGGTSDILARLLSAKR